MQAFVSKLMVGLVVAQAVSGWCCHRPCHCLEDEVAEVSHAAPIESSIECCHDDHDSAAVHFEPHCQCHQCLGFCTYVGSAKAQVARPFSVLGPVPLAAISTADRVQLSAERGAGSRELAAFGPPVGLHLLHKSLLI
jgi:hypothetical protein